MDRRGFLKALGIGTVATAAPITAAYAMKNTVNQADSPGDFPTFMLNNNKNKVTMSVGKDGRLWIRANDQGEWKRLAIEE